MSFNKVIGASTVASLAATTLAGSTVEQRLARLESVVKIEDDGTVTIQSTKKIRIKAAGAVEVEGATSVTVKGTSGVDVHAMGSIDIQGFGQVKIQGTQVRLNNGLMPIARVGDPVGTSGGQQIVLPSSGATVTVLA